MKRVLFISYFFPPLGGAGVQRALKFARYLPAFDWEPVVLTGSGDGYWLTDPTLATELPGDLNVLRSFSPDGGWMASRVRRGVCVGTPAVRAGSRTSRLRGLAGWVLLPDAYRPWKPFALRAARKWLRDHRSDIILTTSSPDTAHLIGCDLARETGLPWVADFRDPWTRRIAFDPPTALHRRMQSAMERAVVTEAAAIIVTADETRHDFMERYPDLPPSKLVVIPNGFDPDDFPANSTEPDWGEFRIVYAGQLTAGRNITPVIDVLSAFFERLPEAREVTRVHMVGPHETENVAAGAAAKLDDVIGFESALPHAKAVRRLYDAHVVLLVENMGPRAGLIIQGKVYECLYTGRPILGIVPPGGARRIVEAYDGGCACGEGEAAKGADFLAEAYRAWTTRKLLPGADPARLQVFDRRKLTCRLSEILNDLTPRA